MCDTPLQQVTRRVDGVAGKDIGFLDTSYPVSLPMVGEVLGCSARTPSDLPGQKAHSGLPAPKCGALPGLNVESYVETPRNRRSGVVAHSPPGSLGD